MVFPWLSVAIAFAVGSKCLHGETESSFSSWPKHTKSSESLREDVGSVHFSRQMYIQGGCGADKLEGRALAQARACVYSRKVSFVRGSVADRMFCIH